jgi:hypothetical protein
MMDHSLLDFTYLGTGLYYTLLYYDRNTASTFPEEYLQTLTKHKRFFIFGNRTLVYYDRNTASTFPQECLQTLTKHKREVLRQLSKIVIDQQYMLKLIPFNK